MSRNKSEVSGVQVYQEYDLYWNISGYIKMSGHYSRYCDNYKNQVCHVRCQVIAYQVSGDISQVLRISTVNVSTSSESISSDTGK